MINNSSNTLRAILIRHLFKQSPTQKIAPHLSIIFNSRSRKQGLLRQTTDNSPLIIEKEETPKYPVCIEHVPANALISHPNLRLLSNSFFFVILISFIQKEILLIYSSYHSYFFQYDANVLYGSIGLIHATTPDWSQIIYPKKCYCVS